MRLIVLVPAIWHQLVPLLNFQTRFRLDPSFDPSYALGLRHFRKGVACHSRLW